MADVNLVVLTGVSTKNAVLRTKNSGQIKAEFSLQVDRPFVRADGQTVSDLFLVDAWGELAEWTYQNVRTGTRVFIIGTLNKESYVTRSGGKEHLTVVKAKHIDLASNGAPTITAELDEIRKDKWDSSVIVSQLLSVREAIES